MMHDEVTQPKHYKLNAHGVECIDAIQACTSDEGFEEYLRGNVMKYLWRCNYKDHKVKALKKAQWYLSKLLSICDVESDTKQQDMFSVNMGRDDKEFLYVEDVKEVVDASE